MGETESGVHSMGMCAEADVGLALFAPVYASHGDIEWAEEVVDTENEMVSDVIRKWYHRIWW